MESIKSNIEKLDEYIGGFPVSCLTIICGLPFSGKTLLSSEIASKTDVDVNHYLIEEIEPKHIKMSKENYSFRYAGHTKDALDLADTQIMNNFSGLVVIDDIDEGYEKCLSKISSTLKLIQDKNIALLITIRNIEFDKRLFSIAESVINTRITNQNGKKKIIINKVKDRSKKIDGSISFDLLCNGSLSLV